MKKIVLTGGGTAGHVTPNIALLPALADAGFEVTYMGSYDGIEKRLIHDFRIPYVGISTGKLRRYLDARNFTDPFRVLKGFAEAKRFLREYAPDIVFSKGGFVSVPVVRAAASLGIPCIVHESDMTPGLANKLCIPVATRVCCSFPETFAMLPQSKAVLTGSPVRAELSRGKKEIGLRLTGFDSSKPILMVIGGSLGASSVNKAIREALPRLLADFQVLHLCGKDKLDNLLLSTPGYRQYEYVKEELKDFFAMADIVVSRAGANAICELLELNKPSLLIPLPAASSRGDQLLNARSFADAGFSMLLNEDDMTQQRLVESIHTLYENRASFQAAMQKSQQIDAVGRIMELILELS